MRHLIRTDVKAFITSRTACKPMGSQCGANSTATRWLYLCHEDRWRVAGDDVMEAGFVDSAGWISQSATAGGKMPYDMVTHWQR
jgi:hypothetical protein